MFLTCFEKRSNVSNIEINITVFGNLNLLKRNGFPAIRLKSALLINIYSDEST